jgi:tRNA pseudouridine65 synthase
MTSRGLGDRAGAGVSSGPMSETVSLPEPTIRPLRVLHRDADVVVVDKPAGLAVHRGWAPERDVAMTRVRDALGVRVHPVHRLDRGTSGVLVLALSVEAATPLSQAFAAGHVHKQYLALVRGVPPEALLIDHPLPPGEDKTVARVPARTRILRREVFGRYSLVEAQPETGRLHQIRRHLKHIACPIIGDVNYGKGEHNRLFRERFELHRMFLHALAVSFPHPATGAVVSVHAPLPPELENVLARLRAS